jgi:DNA-binding transcriptional LysR family regulator
MPFRQFQKTITYDMIDLLCRYLDGTPMDVSDLKIFETVARCSGMKRAAIELNTVQSNVTARIKALETDIGCALFDRHSRGVSLTPAGRRLLPYAEQTARLLSDAKRAARDDGTPRGALAIGSLETTAALRLTPLLSRYAAENSEVDLTLHTGTTRELIAAVAGQRLDGAFVCGPATHPALEEQMMFREELVVLAAPRRLVPERSVQDWHRAHGGVARRLFLPTDA